MKDNKDKGLKSLIHFHNTLSLEYIMKDDVISYKYHKKVKEELEEKLKKERGDEKE
tara:strand:- start:512 stop:679 length:168 start_codon:yes stop_codon:yes gene_type:complete